MPVELSVLKMPHSLPSDGTTSTNYGPSFEVSTTTIFALRCCKQDRSFAITINSPDHEPWDDIVAEMDDCVLCAQLKHNEKLHKGKLMGYMDNRQTLLDKHGSSKMVFVFFTTSPDNAIREQFAPIKTYPDVIANLLTNKASLYEDQSLDNSPTYLCMNQNNVSSESADVKQALLDFIGPFLGENHVKDIQTHFMDYMRRRYLRLLGTGPITHQEIRRQIAYSILSRFKVEYKPGAKVEVEGSLEEALKAPLVVLSHRWESAFKTNVWYHLLACMEKTTSKKQLQQGNLEKLWMEGGLHMPVLSPDKQTDKIILRALEIGGWEQKLIVLRPRTFTIRPGQDVITLLQNLNASDFLHMKTDGDAEAFRFGTVRLAQIKNAKLHPDCFAKTAREFLKSKPLEFVEGHDEAHFVNDANAVGAETLSAVCAAIRVKDVDRRVVEDVIRLGADVNASMADGLRPIFYAIEEGRTDLVQLLLESGASPDPADKMGMRPLFHACLGNQVDVVELLIRHGADRNTADVAGVRPLFMAYHQGHFDVMRLLLRGFDRPAAANTQGSHILHQAGQDGSVECLRCVVDCCPSVKPFMTGDVLGKTPLDLARDNGHQEFVEVLEEALRRENAL